MGHVVFNRRHHLFHQIVVPVAADDHMRGGPQIDRLDQVVIDVGIDARLQEGIKRRPG